MKIGFVILVMFILTISCAGKITDVTITKIETNKKYEFYMLNYDERPDSIMIVRDCPWIKDSENTVFIYKPICFTINNNTGKRIGISLIDDNLSFENYCPIMVNNKSYTSVDGRLHIESGEKLNITAFVHLPVMADLLDKSDYKRYFPDQNNRKKDSIVVKKINIALGNAIDMAFVKKKITVHYYENKKFNGGALAIYCVKNQKSTTFRMDSLVKLKEPFIYNCD